eukprot:scaffold21543_cov145-Skeletonema_menzelii.AAC.5
MMCSFDEAEPERGRDQRRTRGDGARSEDGGAGRGLSYRANANANISSVRRPSVRQKKEDKESPNER